MRLTIILGFMGVLQAWAFSGWGTKPKGGLAVLQSFTSDCLDVARNRLQNAI